MSREHWTAVPILDKEAYVVSMDYSPLLAGFSIVLKDGRAGFLTSSNLKFDPNVSLFNPGFWFNRGLIPA